MKLFRSFRLDPVNQCLWRGEHRVPLTPKAFDVLRYLVEHPGRLVTQDELLEALWPETYVNPELIKKYILGIRKVLGDQHENPTFIETIPKRGYQFVAQVTEEIAIDTPDLASDSASKIVGREEALSELLAALNKTLRGQRQVIFIAGESGIGKTTLVDSFQQRVSLRKNLRIARGQCVEGFGGKEPYYPVLEALGNLARTAARDALVQTFSVRAPTWLVQFPSLVRAEQRESLQREILGATRERMVRELCDAVESFTSETPLMLVLEDLHWVDRSTLDLISAIARRRERAKLLIICTYRPVDVILSKSPLKDLKQDLQVHNLCTEIALERLEEHAVAEYLESEFPIATLPSDMSKMIHRHSGGNPLFMVAIVQDLVRRGLISQEDTEPKTSTPLGTVDLGVPQSLRQMLQLQFEQLSASEQEILEAGSVVGESFAAWTLASALDERPDRLEDVCDRLAARQHVIQSRASQELPNGAISAHYEFRHSLYREAIYRNIPAGKRARLHRAIANRLMTLHDAARRDMASAIAFHFENGLEYAQATRFLILAAENAARRFAYRGCIHVLEHALSLVPKIEARVAAELEVQIDEFIGDAQYALGRMSESAAAYGSAASRAGEAGIKSAEVSGLSSMMRPFGFIDPDRGIAAVNRAVEVARTLQDPPLLARTEMLAAGCRLLYDRWREEDALLCRSAYDRLKDLGQTGSSPFHHMIYGHVQALQGNYREAFEILENGMPTLGETKSLMEYIFAISGITIALLRVGRLGDVLHIVRDGKAMAEKNGNDPWLFNFREAWLRMLALDFEGSVQVCESISRTNVPYLIGQPQTIAKIARGYAIIAKARKSGDYQRALDLFQEVRDTGTKFFLHWLWRMIAQLGMSEAWLQANNIQEAGMEADAFSKSALQTADPHLQVLAWEIQARVALAKEQWTNVKSCLAQAIAVLHRFDVPVAAWRVHATAWQLYRSQQRHSEAEMHRERAEENIFRIADSFPADEPLRASFLSAAPIAHILSGTAKGLAADS